MSGNPARTRAVQERRRSSAAGPHAGPRRGEVFEPDYLDRDELGTCTVSVPGFEPHVSPVYGVSSTGGVLVLIKGQRRYVPGDWISDLELDPPGVR